MYYIYDVDGWQPHSAIVAMDYRIAQAPASCSQAQVKMKVKNEPETETVSSVTSHLYLRSSETLDKDVVLRLIRHHRVRTRVRALLVGTTGEQNKWEDLQDDAFSNPWPAQGGGDVLILA